MSIYPSLEDMKFDQLARAQLESTRAVTPGDGSVVQQPSAPNEYAHYPDLCNFMGLELSDAVIAANMPEYSSQRQHGMIAPLSNQSMGLQRAQVTHGIRQVVLCKDGHGRIGLRVKSLNTGVFVCLVVAKSPAALAGIRFGDQILSINDESVAGFSMDRIHHIFKKSPGTGINVALRDRPFERTITLYKDSVGTLGFQFKNGKIISIVKDSSAAKNGLLTNYHVLEVDGQNVVGVKDKDISALIDTAGPIVTATIIPSFIYEHMIQSMSEGLMKNLMDHSVPAIKMDTC